MTNRCVIELFVRWPRRGYRKTTEEITEKKTQTKVEKDRNRPLPDAFMSSPMDKKRKN